MRTSLVVLCLFLQFACFSQWNWVNPLPQGNTLHDVQFVNATTGIAVGDCGTILRTTDSGASWTTVVDDPSVGGLNAVSFPDPDTGFAISDGGSYLYKTTDGGLTWSFLYSFDTFNMWDVWFTDALHGTAIGDECVFLTSDGGVHWAWKGPYTWNYSIWYTSPSTAIMTCQSSLYKSYDGGNTWTVKIQNFNGWQGSLFFMNADTGLYVGMGGMICRTTDGGEHWSTGPILTTKTLSAACILQSGKGFIVGGSGKMLKTDDFGVSWYTLPALTDHDLETVTFSDQLHGVIMGKQGIIFNTVDGGNSWTNLTASVTRKQLNAVVFSDPNTGYIAGDSATLLKTVNGGGTWQPVAIPGGTDFKALCFTGVQTGYVAGSNGTVWKTLDGGGTWTPLQVSSHDPDAIEFPDAFTGYVLTGGTNLDDSIILYRTTNAGSSWVKRYLGLGYDCFMDFTSPDTGYLAANNNIRKTTDGGNTWTVLATFQVQGFGDLCFSSKTTGFACAMDAYGNGINYKTTDAGLHWEPFYAGPVFFSRMHFADSQNGYAMTRGDLGNVSMYKTVNGGLSWSQKEVGMTCYLLRDFCFNGSGTGILAGDCGVILRTTNSGGIVTGVQPAIGPNEIVISPNPCRDRFRIQFPDAEHSVDVSIYSMLGKEVFSSGYSRVQSIDVNVSSLHAGTWLVRITTGSEVTVRKLVKTNEQE